VTEGSGQTHTSSQADGITRALIRASVAASVTGVPSGARYLNPRPYRRCRIPGAAGSLRTRPSTSAWLDVAGPPLWLA
jgi:hypothetical protein